MAITSFSSANYLSRSTSLLNYNNPYTVMGLFYVTSATTGTFFTLTDNLFNSINYDSYGLTSGNYNLQVVIDGTYTTSSPAFIGANQWVHFAAVRTSATAVQCYQNGETITSPASSDTVDRISSIAAQAIGFFATANPSALSGYAFNVFEYDVALTQKEIQQQMYRYRPQRTANLRAWFPMFADSSRNLDFSGNGRDYSEVGTLTNVAGLLLPLSPLISIPRSVAPPPPYYASPSMLMAC